MCQPWKSSPYKLDEDRTPSGQGSQHEELNIMYSDKLDENYYYAKLEWIVGPCCVVPDVTISIPDLELNETGFFTLITPISHWGELLTSNSKHDAKRSRA